ncbi:hypothetical protein ACFL96_13370 [Thermoproteota archaeon]
MHFTIDKDNNVGGFHIEMWDSQALGPELVKKIESHKGKKLDVFLKFALKQRLFQKLRIMYMMSPGKSVYFWASAACLGKESLDQLMYTMKAFKLNDGKYAEILLKPKGTGSNSVLVEDALAIVYQKLKLPYETIELEMKPDEARDISIDFNVSRNRQNLIRVLTKREKDNNVYMNMSLKGVKFIAIKSNGALDIYTADQARKLSKEEIEKYAAFIPTVASNDEEKKEIDEVFEQVTKNRKGTVTEQKTKKKGFFSKVFKK